MGSKIAQMNVYRSRERLRDRRGKQTGGFREGEGRSRPRAGEGQARARGRGAGPGERLRVQNCCAETQSEQGCTVRRGIEP